ncbi:hypothetical protein ACLOJK_003872, partial [Asimina triloba]
GWIVAHLLWIASRDDGGLAARRRRATVGGGLLLVVVVVAAPPLTSTLPRCTVADRMCEGRRPLVAYPAASPSSGKKPRVARP